MERLVIFAIMLLVGCTSWERLPERQPVPARRPIQVWRGGQADTLRDVRLVGDTIMGRWSLPDTTSHWVQLSSVDSVRVERADLGKVVIIGSAVGIALLLAYLGGLQGLGS